MDRIGRFTVILATLSLVAVRAVAVSRPAFSRAGQHQSRQPGP